MSTVAVTGVGAIIGYGLLRSFRASGRPLQLVGCDIYPDAVGQAWCDVFEQAPPTASDSYLDWLEALLRRHRVTLLVPGIEQDVQRFAAARQRLEACGCRVALNDAALIELASDKWAMHEALARIDDAVRIPSRLDGSFDQLSAEFGLPFILKPRRSYASKGLVRVSGRESFEPHRRLLGEALMAQPIVGSDEEEYTVGVFGDGAGGIAASITLRRRLAADGSTAKAWVRQEPSLAPTVAASSTSSPAGLSPPCSQATMSSKARTCRS